MSIFNPSPIQTQLNYHLNPFNILTGDNLVTHNMNLSNPNAVIWQAVDSTGTIIDLQASLFTANTTTFTSPVDEL
jgi:hypothetical protein